MTRRAAAFAAAGVALALLAALADVAQGQGDVDVFDALFGSGETLGEALFFDIRLPRALAGIIAGGALAAAAVVLQALTRNPLAEPATLGMTAGGALTVTLAAAYASLAPGAPTIAVAFVGVAVGTLLIGAMAAAGGGGIRLILAGMAVGLALSAASGAVRLARETETSGLFLWGAGSLLQTGWGPVKAAALIGIPAVLAIVALARALDVAVLGEDTARGLGLRSRATQIVGVALAAVLTAVAVGLCGPIAFIGVLACGLARYARPKGHAGMLAVAIPWGGAILLSADVAGRAITGLDTETPAGVVCALIGAPVLVIVARRLRGEVGPAVDQAASAARWRPKATVVALALLPVAIVGSLCLGEIDIGPREVLSSLFGTGSPLGEIALESRAPRLAVALLGGACLAASGTVLQAAVRNPFAGPELAGVVGWRVGRRLHRPARLPRRAHDRAAVRGLRRRAGGDGDRARAGGRRLAFALRAHRPGHHRGLRGADRADAAALPARGGDRDHLALGLHLRGELGRLPPARGAGGDPVARRPARRHAGSTS